MSYCTSWGAGYSGTENQALVWGRGWRSGDRGLLNCPGSHSLAIHTFGVDEMTRAQGLADAGYRYMGFDMGQTTTQGTFGNDTSVTRVGEARTYLTGTIGASTRPMPIMGGSGGATAAINYARANPQNISKIVGLAPLVDIDALHDLPSGTLAAAGLSAAEIETAYGGAAAYEAALATHSPSVADLSALVNIPIKLWYSTDDPLIDPATVTAFATRITDLGGVCKTASLGAVGHSATGLDVQDVIDFLVRDDPVLRSAAHRVPSAPLVGAYV